MTQPAHTLDQVPATVRQALEHALERKALGPVLLHVTEVAGYTDWVLLLSGRSERHVEGITQAIVQGLKGSGTRPMGSDGLADHLWDLLDYDDFIVHVFYHPVRTHYDLEGMWSDAPRVDLDLPEEVMDTETLRQLEAPDPMPTFRGGNFGGYADEFDDDGTDEAVDADANADDDELDDEFSQGEDGSDGDRVTG